MAIEISSGEATLAGKRRWGHIWLHTPQRSRLRRALFQIHLWVGLVLSLYAVAIGLSGSALVFREELQRKIEPHIYVVKPDVKHASWDAVVNSVRVNHPALKVLTIGLPTRPDESAYVMLVPSQKKLDRSKTQMYYFNPYTGQILGEESRFEGPLGWVANFHYFLFAGEPGLIVNGIMGLGFLILCISGIILWWPGVKRWAKATLYKRRSNWKRLTWDLHSVTGFWCAAALALLAFTGAYFAFPIPISLITILGTGGNPKQVIALLTPPQAKESSAPALTLDDIYRVAQSALPPDCPAAVINPPVGTQSAYTVVGFRRGAAPYSQSTTLSIDSHTGAILKKVESSQYPLGMRLTQYFTALHFGSFGGNGMLGILVKILWVILGAATAGLGATGALMYWNRYLGQKWRSRKYTPAAKAILPNKHP